MFQLGDETCGLRAFNGVHTVFSIDIKESDHAGLHTKLKVKEN